MRCANRRAATAGYPKEENLLRVLHQPPRLGLLNPLSNTGDFANRIDLLETLEIESGSRTSVTPHQSWATDKIIPPPLRHILTKIDVAESVAFTEAIGCGAFSHGFITLLSQ